jgi:hypothetical protein
MHKMIPSMGYIEELAKRIGKGDKGMSFPHYTVPPIPPEGIEIPGGWIVPDTEQANPNVLMVKFSCRG